MLSRRSSAPAPLGGSFRVLLGAEGKKAIWKTSANSSLTSSPPGKLSVGFLLYGACESLAGGKRTVSFSGCVGFIHTYSLCIGWMSFILMPKNWEKYGNFWNPSMLFQTPFYSVISEKSQVALLGDTLSRLWLFLGHFVWSPTLFVVLGKLSCCLFVCLFLAAPAACRSSLAWNQTRATAVTPAATVTMPDP